MLQNRHDLVRLRIADDVGRARAIRAAVRARSVDDVAEARRRDDVAPVDPVEVDAGAEVLGRLDDDAEVQAGRLLRLQVRVAGVHARHLTHDAVFRVEHRGEERRDRRRDLRQRRGTEALAVVGTQRHRLDRRVLQADLRRRRAAVVAVVVVARRELRFEVLQDRQPQLGVGRIAVARAVGGGDALAEDVAVRGSGIRTVLDRLATELGADREAQRAARQTDVLELGARLGVGEGQRRSRRAGEVDPHRVAHGIRVLRQVVQVVGARRRGRDRRLRRRRDVEGGARAGQRQAVQVLCFDLVARVADGAVEVPVAEVVDQACDEATGVRRDVVVAGSEVTEHADIASAGGVRVAGHAGVEVDVVGVRAQAGVGLRQAGRAGEERRLEGLERLDARQGDFGIGRDGRRELVRAAAQEAVAVGLRQSRELVVEVLRAVRVARRGHRGVGRERRGGLVRRQVDQSGVHGLRAGQDAAAPCLAGRDRGVVCW